MAGPQARFDMRNLDPPIKSREGTSESCRRIALNHHHIGLGSDKHVVEIDQDATCYLCQRLILPHQIQVIIGNDTKKAKRLIKHRPMLRGYAHFNIELGMVDKLVYQRCELNRLRAGANSYEDFH